MPLPIRTSRHRGVAASARRPAPGPDPRGTSQRRARLGAGDAGASLTARYAGPQFEDDQNSRTLKGAFTLDAPAAPLSHGLRIEARAENIFDAEVQAGISGLVVERAAADAWIGFRYRLR